MDRERFSNYVNSRRRRQRLIAAIWLPIVLVSLLLAVALPSEYGSTATFQLKAKLNDQTRGDNYADRRYISTLTGTVLGSPELRAALAELVPYPQLQNDPAAALKKLQGDVNVEMITQKILDPLTGLERKINTGFTVTYTNRDPETAQRVAAWLANAFLLDSRRAAAAAVLKESRLYDAEAERQLAKITQAKARLAQFTQEDFDRLPDTVQANLNAIILTARQLYEQLNSKRVDADIRAAAIKIGTADRFTLVAPPLVPRAPTKPPRIGIALIGLIGGTFLAALAAKFVTVQTL